MAKKKKKTSRPKQKALRKKIGINKGGVLAAVRRRDAALRKQIDALNK